MRSRRPLANLLAGLCTLLLSVGPALDVVVASPSCSCDTRAAPCRCCVSSGEKTSNQHVAKGERARDRNARLGRCHLRTGPCQASSPHPAETARDLALTAILDLAILTDQAPAGSHDRLLDPRSPIPDIAGPEPPPPRLTSSPHLLTNLPLRGRKMVESAAPVFENPGSRRPSRRTDSTPASVSVARLECPTICDLSRRTSVKRSA
jgi:hypothetical protein